MGFAALLGRRRRVCRLRLLLSLGWGSETSKTLEAHLKAWESVPAP